MILKDGNDHMMFPEIPDVLADRIKVGGSVSLNRHECDLFATALKAIEVEFEKSSPPCNETYASVILVDADEFILQIEEHVYGNFAPFVIYPVHKWRAKNLSDVSIIVCILEELCHCLWNIPDEILVKHKTLAVFHHLAPNATLYDLYGELCNLHG